MGYYMYVDSFCGMCEKKRGSSGWNKLSKGSRRPIDRHTANKNIGKKKNSSRVGHICRFRVAKYGILIILAFVLQLSGVASVPINATNISGTTHTSGITDKWNKYTYPDVHIQDKDCLNANVTVLRSPNGRTLCSSPPRFLNFYYKPSLEKDDIADLRHYINYQPEDVFLMCSSCCEFNNNQKVAQCVLQGAPSGKFCVSNDNCDILAQSSSASTKDIAKTTVATTAMKITSQGNIRSTPPNYTVKNISLSTIAHLGTSSNAKEVPSWVWGIVTVGVAVVVILIVCCYYIRKKNTKPKRNECTDGDDNIELREHTERDNLLDQDDPPPSNSESTVVDIPDEPATNLSETDQRGDPPPYSLGDYFESGTDVRETTPPTSRKAPVYEEATNQQAQPYYTEEIRDETHNEHVNISISEDGDGEVGNVQEIGSPSGAGKVALDGRVYDTSDAGPSGAHSDQHLSDRTTVVVDVHHSPSDSGVASLSEEPSSMIREQLADNQPNVNQNNANQMQAVRAAYIITSPPHPTDLKLPLPISQSAVCRSDSENGKVLPSGRPATFAMGDTRSQFCSDNGPHVVTTDEETHTKMLITGATGVVSPDDIHNDPPSSLSGPQGEASEGYRKVLPSDSRSRFDTDDMLVVGSLTTEGPYATDAATPNLPPSELHGIMADEDHESFDAATRVSDEAEETRSQAGSGDSSDDDDTSAVSDERHASNSVLPRDLATDGALSSNDNSDSDSDGSSHRTTVYSYVSEVEERTFFDQISPSLCTSQTKLG